ncbi:hypothetical protein LNTAR_00855 [Lentisphaera araneosa HTCC2155]|uniref:Uncharacterized protein n=1 Tax=Lentisphaera araneosa HTCC2155 TaxID=313628 RepID=A6DKK8_9BACT|nr:hypothetical protein [Lentisphaera araneosa]EDM27906.1 hypothetical protein LNTAR_00855 [Lentisphaera araneosa HTCC2155]
MRFLVLFFCLSSYVFGQGFQTYSTEIGSGIQISYRTLFQSASLDRPGARVPMQVKISNKTDETLSWGFKAYDGWGNIADSEFNTSFTVESNAVRTFTLNLPYNNMDDYHTFYSPSFKISGPGVDVFSNIRPFGEQMTSGKMCTQKAYKKIQLYSEKERKGKKSQSSGSRAYMLDYEYTYFEIQNLSVNWQSYSGISEIMMTAAEFQSLQEEIKSALRDWVVSGGFLILVDPANDLARIKSQSYFHKQETPGLGAVRFLDKGKRPDSLKSGKRRLAENFFNLEKKNFVKEISEPKASFIFFTILLIVFLVLLIPVNFLVFTKKNRLKLLVTTPLISLGASIVFFIVIILSDGFGGTGVKSTLLYLCPELKRCSIYQSQVSRTGIMTSKNFDIQNDLLIDAYSLTRERWDDSSYPMKAKIVFNDTSVGGDLFNSRTRRFVDIRHVKSTQAAVELIAGDKIQLRSSFQSTIKKIYVKNADNKIWMAENLVPGEAVTAKEISVIDDSEVIEKLQSLMKNESFGFLAVLSEAGEFDIPTHNSIDWQEHRVYAAGILKEVTQ